MNDILKQKTNEEFISYLEMVRSDLIDSGSEATAEDYEEMIRRLKVMPHVEEITFNMIDNIMVAALEGGSNYWIDDVNVLKVPDGVDWKYASDALASCGVLEITTQDEPLDKMELCHADIERGIRQAAQHHGATIEQFYNNHDANDADVALQFALFNEVVYG